MTLGKSPDLSELLLALPSVGARFSGLLSGSSGAAGRPGGGGSIEEASETLSEVPTRWSALPTQLS